MKSALAIETSNSTCECIYYNQTGVKPVPF